MWPFLLILAIVPMIFFWSDSVRDVFPALKEYLPEQSSSALLSGKETPNLPPELAAGAEPGRWYVSQTEKGYVAWVMSADSQYRVSVGCHNNAPATLQVTHLTGATLPDGLHLNYQYGLMPLTTGYFTGETVINDVAQFQDVYLQNTATEVLAQFTVPAADSNTVARAVQTVCATSPAAADIAVVTETAIAETIPATDAP